MGASCSSSNSKKYRDSLYYLRSKPCTTYTYSRSFSPLVKKLPYVIIIGEHHLENPSRCLKPDNRKCSTVSGIMNELVSICSDPVSKPTVFIEDKVEDTDHKEHRKDKEVLFDVQNRENPFNVNRQKVLFDHMERKYDKNVVEIIRSDIFFLARGQFLFEGIIPTQNTIELFTDSNLIEWTERIIGLNYRQYEILKEEGQELAKEHWSHFDEDIRNDSMLKYLAEFSHIILLIVKTYETRLFHSDVTEYVRNRIVELFLQIEKTFEPTSGKRKREYDNESMEVIPHYYDIGLLITFLGDVLNFYHIGTLSDIVLISYGQVHSENFTEMLEESNLYKLDHEFGENEIF